MATFVVNLQQSSGSRSSNSVNDNEVIIDEPPIEMELDPNSIPSVGKTSNSLDEAFDCYCNYAIGANTANEAAYVIDFFKRSTRMCYMAAKSERGRAFFNEALSKTFEGLCKIEEELILEQQNNSTQASSSQIHETASSRLDATERVDALLLDPHISQTKGRKKSNVVWDEFVDTNKRIKGGMELSQRPAKTCSICHKKDRHNARTCPLRKKNQVGDVEENEDQDEDDAEEDVDLVG